LSRAGDFIVRIGRLPAAEIAPVLSKFGTIVFRLIALDQFPTNPLIRTRTQVEIFKVRNPIRNFHDKLAPQRPFVVNIVNIEFKDSEIDQAGE
jgi:hypothetical protein